MKLLKHLLILSIFMGLLTGCGKELSEENGNLPGNTGPGQVTGDFRAKINGEQWVANKAAAAARISGLINLTGLSTQGRLLTITLTDSGAKTYTLDENSINFAAYVDSTETNRDNYSTIQSDVDSLAGGTVTISRLDTVNKTISGTFTFKVYRQQDNKKKSFTEGVFTNLSYSTTMPPANTSDTFRVKVNNVAWVSASIFAIKANGKININSTDAGNTKNIGLSINETITPGNAYTWSILDNIAVYNPVTTMPPTPYSGSGGNLTILEHNTTTKRIRGTFNFVAKTFPIPVPPDINFTEGYFSIKY